MDPGAGFEPASRRSKRRILPLDDPGDERTAVSRRPQSLNGSNTSAPAITTMNGRSVCSIFDRARVMREHVGQAAVGLRRLVEIAADEVHALLAQPRLHLVGADAALRRSTSPVLRLTLALGLGARHHAAGAVHGRVEALRPTPRSRRPRGSRRRRPSSRRRSRAGRETPASRPCAPPTARARRGARARRSCDGCARVSVTLAHEDAAHALHHPLAAGIGVLAGERHRRDVALRRARSRPRRSPARRRCRPCRRRA